VYELTPQRASLEEAFMEMTRDSVEYGGRPAVGVPASRADERSFDHDYTRSAS
jgi:hypothetical protein